MAATGCARVDVLAQPERKRRSGALVVGADARRTPDPVVLLLHGLLFSSIGFVTSSLLFAAHNRIITLASLCSKVRRLEPDAPAHCAHCAALRRPQPLPARRVSHRLVVGAGWLVAGSAFVRRHWCTSSHAIARRLAAPPTSPWGSVLSLNNSNADN